MTSNLETMPLDVLTDGGSAPGILVLADGKLAAVLVRVRPEETGEPEPHAGGWYVEAGFGPCGILMTLTPQVFADDREALDWVSQQLAQAAAVAASVASG
jgi:hypothetical protein